MGHSAEGPGRRTASPRGRKTRGERRSLGFTLIELVVVVAILGILISLAVPRYLSTRKKAYLEEADNALQEAKTLEWAYYQQWNLFDTSAAGASIGFAVPGGMHWAAPAFNGTNAASGNAVLTITMSGNLSPLNSGTDSVSVLLYSDGSSGGGSTF